MTKSPDAFRTISEVADWLEIQAHVLRFWESKFAPVKPIKRAGGRRYYRPSDMMLLAGIKKLLYDDGITIKGVQKIIREQGVSYVSELAKSVDISAASIEVEVEELNATVLQFQPLKAASPELQTDIEEPTEDAAAEDKPEAAAEPIDDPAEDPDENTVSEDATEPKSPSEDPEEDEADAAVLPSFLSPPGEADETEKPAAPQPEIPRPAVVDAPDPGPDDTQQYSPGTLGHLAGLDYLTASQAAEIAPLAKELRSWMDRNNTA